MRSSDRGPLRRRNFNALAEKSRAPLHFDSFDPSLDSNFHNISCVTPKPCPEGVKNLDFGKPPTSGSWIVPCVRYAPREEIQAWRRQRSSSFNPRCPCRVGNKLRTRTTCRTAYHIPNHNSIHSLSAVNNLCAQTRVNARPSVMRGV